MIAVQVMANDVAAGFGGAGGYLEMNVYKPLIIFNIAHSITILTDGCTNFRKFLIEGTKPNLKKIKEYVDRSLMLVTALSPVIGYDKSSQIAHYAMDNDSLWNIKSEQKERLASWNRFRGTVDIDLGELIGQQNWTFHATALWQGGGNLGAYLGLLTSPSGMSSMNTCRFDSWWIEKRWLNERITARVGQFAGQDFYGAQHYAASFIFEPMGYALGNLSTTLESYDPPSTPAMEIRVVPQPQYLCEIDGGSSGTLAFFTKPNRPGPSI